MPEPRPYAFCDLKVILPGMLNCFLTASFLSANDLYKRCRNDSAEEWSPINLSRRL